jgi:hypothetical protein
MEPTRSNTCASASGITSLGSHPPGLGNLACTVSETVTAAASRLERGSAVTEMFVQMSDHV